MSAARKVSTQNLRVGMEVTALDRPWLETPFLLQGFVIRSEQEIARLREYCEYVFVAETYHPEKLPVRRFHLDKPRVSREQLFGKRDFVVYEDQSDWHEEYPRARSAVDQLSDGIDEIFAAVESGSGLAMMKIKAAVQPMIDSITRNPDACIWLARMKQADNYTYQHAIGTSIWAVALGRQLGLPQQDMRSLAIGGLLMDVGKLKLDGELLAASRQLTPDEFSRVQQHVAHGMESFEGQALINQDVLNMVAHHHERLDGSGYPQGLKDDAIPVFGRIAGIVDTYDAITSHRSYARAMTPAAAVKHLYELRGIAFQAELVEEFIQAIGIYPAGTLVELSSGEVAIIVAEYRTRRLRPRVCVLLDRNKQQMDAPQMIDLLTTTETADGRELSIVGSLEPEAYGIDMRGIKL
jgi:HD-GYP domain-containing protein (c-di-GMP phosphodiesterase class II)